MTPSNKVWTPEDNTLLTAMAKTFTSGDSGEKFIEAYNQQATVKRSAGALMFRLPTLMISSGTFFDGALFTALKPLYKKEANSRREGHSKTPSAVTPPIATSIDDLRWVTASEASRISGFTISWIRLGFVTGQIKRREITHTRRDPESFSAVFEYNLGDVLRAANLNKNRFQPNSKPFRKPSAPSIRTTPPTVQPTTNALEVRYAQLVTEGKLTMQEAYQLLNKSQ